MPKCLIGLGSNLGDREQILEAAVDLLRKSTRVVDKSRWLGYPGVGVHGEQQDFLNGALLLETDDTPEQLVALLHDAEKMAGRRRTQRWASRTLDCDLLLFGCEQVVSESLIVPHPRMVTRRFVLEPSVEIAPEMIHPRLGWTIRQLYEHLAAPPYFVVVGPDEAYCRELAHEIACQCQGSVDSLPQRPDSPSATDATSLEFAGKARRLPDHATSENQLPPRTIISTSLHRFGNLGIANNQPWPGSSPKLLIVTEPIDCEFSRQLEGQLPTRVPTVHLSPDREHAIQDAVGAVLAMN